MGDACSLWLVCILFDCVLRLHPLIVIFFTGVSHSQLNYILKSMAACRLLGAAIEKITILVNGHNFCNTRFVLQFVHHVWSLC